VSTHYNEAQFLLALARAAYWTAIVQSGAYKLRQTQIGCGRSEDGSIQFRPKTDDEKLASAVATVQRHLEIAAEFAEHLPVQGMAHHANDGTGDEERE